MRGLVFVLIVLLAVACNGGGESLRTATPAPSPSGTTTPQATATATAVPTAAPEIAYVGPDERDVWLMAIDGSGKRNVTRGRCWPSFGFYWSPQGDRIACITVNDRQTETRVLVFDVQGRVLLRLQHAGYFRSFFTWGANFASPWSPSGRNFAYVVEEKVTPVPEREPPPRGTPVLLIADASRGILTSIAGGQRPRWSADGGRLAYNKPPGDTLALYDLASSEEKTLAEGLRPLAWVLGDEALLVAADYREDEFGVGYQANLLDLASGQITRVPELDNYTEFWLSPDGGTAIVLPHGLPSLAILELASLEFTPIADSVISYPSDFIPQSQLAFSADGSQIYWFDGSDAIYKADSDGGGLTQVGPLPGDFFLAFSPDLRRVLYFVLSDVPPPASGGPLHWNLWVANIDGSDARVLVEGASGAVWRPTR